MVLALLMKGRRRIVRTVVGGIVVGAWVMPELVAGFMWYAYLTWGSSFVPFILLVDPGKVPASVAIFQYFGLHGTASYGLLAAYSILYSMPVVVLYTLAQRLLGNAFALSGAVKG